MQSKRDHVRKTSTKIVRKLACWRVLDAPINKRGGHSGVTLQRYKYKTRYQKEKYGFSKKPNLYHHNPAEEQVEEEYLEDIQKDIIRYINTSVPDRPNWAIRQRGLPGKHGSSRREKKTVKVSLFWEKQVVN